MKYLIVVDIQNDFTRGEGHLPVGGSDKAIEYINFLMEKGDFDKIIATQDWHPKGHISFATTHNKKPFEDTISTEYGKQSLWPEHCVQGTWGADFDDRLNRNLINIIWRKGMNKNIDSYSAILENDKKTYTGLQKYITSDDEVTIVGVATDVCVFFTALDFIKITENVSLHFKGCAGVNRENTKESINHLKKLGVKII
jgi:nicotinamidase/pyrazinamidase